MQVAVKIVVTVVVLVLADAFLVTLWRRELDTSQYLNPRWWGGALMDAWFPTSPNLVKNGSFESRFQAWGTGWIEDLPAARDFARQHKYVNLKGADAQWLHDAQGGRDGAALRVVHRSSKQPHAFSTFSQRIELQPHTTYEARFWAKVEDGNGHELMLRVGVSDETDWELAKQSVIGSRGDWREFRTRFATDDRIFVDIRFTAEAPLRAWIDEVSVREVTR